MNIFKPSIKVEPAKKYIKYSSKWLKFARELAEKNQCKVYLFYGKAGNTFTCRPPIAKIASGEIIDCLGCEPSGIMEVIFLKGNSVCSFPLSFRECTNEN